MIKHMIIQVSHKSIEYLNQANNKVQPPKKDKREQKQHSLLKPMIYTFFSPFGNKLPKKFTKNAQCQIDSQAWCSDGGVEITSRTKASVDEDAAGGVGAGAGYTEVVAGADDVALVSGTGTAADL